jgi:hypothetical protein
MIAEAWSTTMPGSVMRRTLVPAGATARMIASMFARTLATARSAIGLLSATMLVLRMLHVFGMLCVFGFLGLCFRLAFFRARGACMFAILAARRRSTMMSARSVMRTLAFDGTSLARSTLATFWLSVIRQHRRRHERHHSEY